MPKTQIPILVKNDPWLAPYTEEIKNRMARFEGKKSDLEKKYGDLRKFAEGYKYFGLNFNTKDKGWWYREWAPKASALFLTGDFNNWSKDAHPLQKNSAGIWEIFLSEKDTKIGHKSAFKVHVVGDNGHHDRIPAYAKYATQDENTYDFTGRVWNPEKPYKWKNKKFSP